MEITTILGLCITLACLIVGIVQQGSPSAFIDVSSIFITVGGTIGATIASYPLKDLKNMMKVIPIAFKKCDYDLYSTIYKIIDLANIARKDGLLALDNRARDIEDPFLKKGVMLVVDGTDPELIRNIMETEIVFKEDRHSMGSNIMFSASSFAPAFGMIGTLVGLIGMLKNLEDSSMLGTGMATALVTTLYGSILANMVCTPLATKLKNIAEQETKYNELILEGLLSIQAGENPRLIEEKLLSFISKSEQESENSEQGATESSVAG